MITVSAFILTLLSYALRRAADSTTQFCTKI